MKKLLLLLFFCLLAVRGECADKINILTKQSGKETYKITRGIDNDEVVIGDEKSLTFKPKITFYKWNKENSLSILPPAELSDLNTETLSNGKIEVKEKKNKLGWYANPDPDNPDNFKFGLILYEKPSTNTWSFQLEGWEDYDFFYQPPLANINPDGSTWEDNGHGGQCRRPANVSGSWAVYHKTKRDHIVGQTNYGIGKIGHIYNILLTDVDGKSVRVIPDIKDGVYSVTFPQDFLDNAVYPVKANDTFGNTAIGGTNDSGNLDNAYIMYTNSTPSSSGTLTSLTMALWNSSAGTTHSKLALYADSAGTPGALITNAFTGALEITTTTKPTSDLGTWTTGVVSGGSLVSGTTYGIAVVNDSNLVSFAYDSSSGNLRNYDPLAYTSFPANPFGTVEGTWLAYLYSVYATYTPSGASIALTGTVTTATEADIRAGGKTIILTLTGDTWVADGATFNAQRQNIINGLDSAQSEATGWDAEVKAKIAVTDVVRTSDTVCTITLDAESGYLITAGETITATIPASAVVLNAQIVASPTFSISNIALNEKSFRFFNDNGTLPSLGATPVIEAGDTVESGNDTASTSWNVACPAQNTGDLMVCHLVSDANVTHTLPNGRNGETPVVVIDTQSYGDTGTANQRISVWYWIATGNQAAGNVTVTPSATEQWTATVMRVPTTEFNASNPIDCYNKVSSSSNVSNLPSPAMTGVNANGKVVVFIGDDQDPVTGTPSGWTNIATEDRGAVNDILSVRNAGTTWAESIASATWTIASDSYCSIAYVVNAPQTGTATAFGAIGADPTLGVDTSYGFRFRVENGAVAGTDHYKLQYSLNSGAWTDVTSSSSVIKATLSSQFANGDDVPEYILGTGTYTSNNNAALESAGDLTLAAVLAASYSYEGHLNFQIPNADVVNGNTIQIRVIENTGVVFDTYTDIPTITVTEAGAGGEVINKRPRSIAGGILRGVWE